MMIGPAIAGTIAASDSSFTGFTSTPAPIYVNGKWWSFTLVTRVAVPQNGILSRVSVDGGVTWTTDDTTWDSDVFAQLKNDFEVGNGIIAFSTGDVCKSKDLDVANSKWLFTSLINLPGGFINNPALSNIYFDDTNSEFVLSLDQGTDIYTSPDAVTFTSVNGGIANTLNSFLSPDQSGIRYASGKYVATAGQLIVSSTDLIAWSSETNRPQVLFNTYLFNGKYIDYTDNDLTSIKTSTDLLTWTFIESGALVKGANSNGIPDLYSPSYAVVTSTTFTIVGVGFICETTDGVTFTIKGCPFSLYKALFTTAQNANSFSAFAAHGRGSRLNTDAAPTFALHKTLEDVELGGKVLKYATSLADAPTMVYPDGSFGFSEVTGLLSDKWAAGTEGNAAELSGEAFTISSPTLANPQGGRAYGFYIAKSSSRYCEFTVVDASETTTAELGFVVARSDSGDSGIQRFMLLIVGSTIGTASTMEISTNEVDDIALPGLRLTAGQILGFQLNATLAQLTLFVDGVQTLQVPNMQSTLYWALDIKGQGSKINVNVGQDAFIHQPLNTVAWANEYI